MSEVQPRRFRADFPEGTVVFLIGMRINDLRRVREWGPVFMAMPKMMRELATHPELGFLGAESWLRWREPMVQQYWRDMDSLMRYATARDSEHLPAWAAFNRRARESHAVGIWHEAYEVRPETSHIVYRDMPPFGMGKTIGLEPVGLLPPQPVRRFGDAPDELPESA